MSYTEMGKLIDRWMADASFRAAVRTNPEATVQQCGITLTAEEWATVRAVDWSLTDEQLRARVSKLFA